MFLWSKAAHGTFNWSLFPVNETKLKTLLESVHISALYNRCRIKVEHCVALPCHMFCITGDYSCQMCFQILKILFWVQARVGAQVCSIHTWAQSHVTWSYYQNAVRFKLKPNDSDKCPVDVHKFEGKHCRCEMCFLKAKKSWRSSRFYNIKQLWAERRIFSKW